jgi:2,4-dienoyl-CoA reductase (NADPH2)
MENRMRFALEIIASVRRNAGDGYPLIVRVAGHDYMPGSHTNTEARAFCQALEEAGVDAINVTGGWHETKVPQLTYAVPPGAYVYLARAIRGVINIPVMASNRLGDPVMAEKVLREGSADMICMGRPLIADPQLPNKARDGRLDDITYCVGCNQVCFDNVFMGQAVGCMLNPLAGHEGEIEISRAAQARKVVVVGGGPAGMMAAATAAQRGHKVVLLEAGKELGGQLRLAVETPGKADFVTIISTLAHKVKAASVRPRRPYGLTSRMWSLSLPVRNRLSHPSPDWTAPRSSWPGTS